MNNQSRIAAWVRKVFSDEVATNVPERVLRFVEEAIELAQACGTDATTVHRLVDYVFNRPVGEVPQEIAGCMVTLYATAHALGVDAQEELEKEISRIRQPEVIDRVRRRQDEKRAALVATVSASGLEGPKRTSAAPPNAEFMADLDRRSQALVDGVAEYAQAALPPRRPHLIAGEFQSNKYPTTPRGKVPLSVKDVTAQDLLYEYAQRRRAVDAEFADDLEEALRIAGYTKSVRPHKPKCSCGMGPGLHHQIDCELSGLVAKSSRS